MINDPIVNEVRRVRDELAKKFNYDVDAIFADLREKQKKYGNRIVNLMKQRKVEPASAPDAKSQDLQIVLRFQKDSGFLKIMWKLLAQVTAPNMLLTFDKVGVTFFKQKQKELKSCRTLSKYDIFPEKISLE